MAENFANTLFSDQSTEQLLVRECLNKIIAFFAEYARRENDSVDFENLNEIDLPPVSELIRQNQLNNKTELSEPHVE